MKQLHARKASIILQEKILKGDLRSHSKLVLESLST